MQNNKQRIFRLVQCLTVMTLKVMIMMMMNLMETLLRLLLIVKMKTMMMEDQGKSFLFMFVTVWSWPIQKGNRIIMLATFLWCWCFFNRWSAFSNFLVRGPLRSAFSEISQVRADQLFGPWIPDRWYKMMSWKPYIVHEPFYGRIIWWAIWYSVYDIQYIIYKTKIEKSSNPNWILKVIRWNSRGTFLFYFS